MLFGGQRVKEKTVIGVLILLAMLLVTIVIYRNNTQNNSYEEQTVMANEYMQEGKYQKAIKAYENALAMSESERDFISINLAEAYIGLNEYDKALEVLRVSYNKTSGITLKEKIEEVTARKIEYQFNQIISRANTYFSNKEYDKAITEFTKAKLIKSKDIISYIGIAKSYIEKGEYQKARDEVIAGLQLTQSDELNKTLTLVDTYIMKERYDTVVNAAFEYIYQENYNESIAKFKEAIKLKPDEDKAYLGLAELYISLMEYEKAMELLRSVPVDIITASLTELLDQAAELNNKKLEYEVFLSEFYDTITKLDISKIKEMMNQSIYSDIIADNLPLYYSKLNESQSVEENGMIIYDENNIYTGGIQDQTKTGIGIYLVISKNMEDKDYYLYNGEWFNNIPHGLGQTEEVTTEISDKDEKVVYKVVTDGFFDQSMESGNMIKYFYKNDVIVGNTKYIANNGTPNPMYSTNGDRIINEKNSEYAIGILNKGNEPATNYYYVPMGTVWGVKYSANE